MKNKKIKHSGNKKKTALITIICILLAIFLIIMPIISVNIYNSNFGERFETPRWMAFSLNNFKGLKVQECTFKSNKGQLLAGYHYYKENQQIKGVIVLAHGLGDGGHNTYMDIAGYFTSNGYFVFAYDATGNDKSEGNSVEGLPQGVIDLDYALRYVKDTDEYKNLPIMLFGHSWGGYSAGNVLNCHPDVKAAVIVAGFDNSASLFEQQGEAIAGPVIKLFMPYISLYERLKFGKYATYSAIDGFANSNAGIMVLHSKDDSTVLSKNGYEKFYNIYKDNSRFNFIEYKDRGHEYIYYTEEAHRYKEQLNKDYTGYLKKNNLQDNIDIKAEFMEKNLDKSKCYELDYNLMQKILEFYDSYYQK